MEEMCGIVVPLSRDGRPLLEIKTDVRTRTGENRSRAGHAQMSELDIEGMHQLANANARGN